MSCVDGRRPGAPRCRRRSTARKPAEQAHLTALVGEIGADTATIARHLTTIPTRIRFPHRGAEEGLTLGGILGDRPQPRRPAQPRATAAQPGSLAREARAAR